MHNRKRIESVRQQLQEDGLQALLVVSPSACTYLSGCHLLTQTAIPDREAYVLLTAQGDLTYLVCNLEESSARAESFIEDIRTYVEFAKTPALAAAEMLAAEGLGKARIAYEGASMRARSLEILQDSLPGATWKRWDRPLRRHWMVKSDAEVEALRSAGEATREAIERGLGEAPPGASERTLAARIYTGMFQAGITPLFDVFAAGPNMFKTHAAASDRVPLPGELIRVDMGGRDATSLFLSDMARTAVVGEAGARQQETLAALAEIQAEIGNACEVGRPAAELFRICAAAFGRHKLAFGMPHIGHGLGIDLHEEPMIRPGNDTPLAAGMVLNIEPFAALPEFGETYHVEDLVLISESGPRWLTQPQKTLIRAPA